MPKSILTQACLLISQGAAVRPSGSPQNPFAADVVSALLNPTSMG